MKDDRSLADNLTEKQQQKNEQTGSSEEIINMLEECGFELSDEQLDNVVGGTEWRKEL